MVKSQLVCTKHDSLQAIKILFLSSLVNLVIQAVRPAILVNQSHPAPMAQTILT